MAINYKVLSFTQEACSKIVVVVVDNSLNENILRILKVLEGNGYLGENSGRLLSRRSVISISTSHLTKWESADQMILHDLDLTHAPWALNGQTQRLFDSVG